MHIKFKTSDLFFWQAVVAVIIAQFVLCYDAMTCRGYPPMTELELNKMLISPLFVWIPAVFGTRVNRMRGIMAMSISITFFLTMVYIDDGIRPSIGSLAGPIGIILAYNVQLLFMAVITTPLAFVALYYYERVAGDLWRLICFQRTENLTFNQTWERAWGRKPPPMPT